jgi:OOP family OmpA-OmpF porin
MEDVPMKKIVRYLLLAATASLLFAPSAFAGQRAGAFTLSPLVGYHIFEGDQKIDDDMAYGLGFGYNLTKRVAIELDFRYTPTNIDIPGFRGKDVEVWTGSVNALYHFNPDGPFVPYLAAGFGGMIFEVDDVGGRDSDEDFMLNAGAGFKYFFSDNLALRFDARYIADQHSDRNFEQRPSSDDLDHNVMLMAGLTWQFGGPPPAPAPPLDSDGDGIPDSRDKCPGTPLGTAVDAVGCPPAAPKPAPAPAPVVVPPPVVAQPAPAVREIITLNLLFDFDSAAIKEEMIPVLEQARQILQEDSATSFLVLGHTCNLGSDAYNQKLSERRAGAVKNWLVGNGIAAERLDAIGYGESRPKYDNSTEESRKLNRRVEIMTR